MLIMTTRIIIIIRTQKTICNTFRTASNNNFIRQEFGRISTFSRVQYSIQLILFLLNYNFTSEIQLEVVI
jgi:hypothetical protein